MAFLKKAWQKVRPVIRGIAPAAAAALGGPYAPLVAGLVKTLVGKPDASDAEVVDLIASQDPEVLYRLRQLDAELEIKREELGIKRDEMYLADLQSARERHVAVKDREPARLTYIAMGALVATVTVFVVVPDPSQPMTYLFGVLTGGLLDLIGKGYNFYLGSSQGSKIKTEQIAEQMATLRSQVPE